MKKAFFLFVALTLLTNYILLAQVTLGSGIAPNRTAMLEIKTRQANSVINTVGDEDNISANGGILLPRVKLVSTHTLEPFIKVNDTIWTKPDRRKEICMSTVGLMVYNINTIGDGSSIYPAIYTWDGVKWSTSQINPSKTEIEVQPKPFSFYEKGDETPVPLTFKVSGAPGVNITYQWYQVTGNNVHVRVGTKIGGRGTINGTGANTDSFTPTGIIKGTTKNANNTGFYKFYCVATDSFGKSLISDIAEVAVGCGAKNNDGDWLSFMCFNLGATIHTIKEQKEYQMVFHQPNADFDNKHYYINGEEKVYGDLYQWGRIGDGHEKRDTLAGFVDGEITAGTNQIEHGDRGPKFENGINIGTWTYPWKQVERGTEYWGKFIMTDDGNWAKNLSVSEINQLWSNGHFSPNDPCAKIKEDGISFETFYPDPDANDPTSANTNWRLPSSDEWGSIFRGGGSPGSIGSATANSWISNPHTSVSGNICGSYEVRPDNETTTLFLPLSGYRGCSNGALYYTGTRGDYWSSTLLGIQGVAIVIYNRGVNPVSRSNLGYGFALRCIKNN